MNIIIPCAGIGERFKEDGYLMPKPLISVLGEPLIFHVIRNLSVSDDDKIYIVYHQDLDAYNFKYILLKEFPKLQFVRINFHTRGPVETVLCGLNKIEDVNKPTLILDCDTFYKDDIIALARLSQDNNNNVCLFYFKDTSDLSLFSFVFVNEGSVIEIKEKERISDCACTGAYLFYDGSYLKSRCAITLDKYKTSKGEFYFSDLYSLILSDREPVTGIEIKNFHCLGTPQQLKEYCLNHDNTTWQNKRFIFDLDNTLVTYPEKPGDYENVRPITKTINYLKYLKSLGNTIIIHTARGMKSSQNNAELATNKNKQQVLKTLHDFDIPYDEIYFGKPWGDFYIDDLSVRPFEDLDKHIGYYNAKVEPRSFNNIVYNGDRVIKQTNNPGEIYFYKNIPANIKQYFPESLVFLPPDPVSKFSMEKINGVPFSYLLINNSLTYHNYDALMSTLAIIHNSEKPDKLLQVKENINVYANYIDKMDKRYASYPYHEIATDTHQTHFAISQKLHEYRQNGLAQIGIIHGDPVFSNIFLCHGGRIKFIDMRGMVGGQPTIYGDIFYDYAKVYQSLLGYDFIAAGYEINETYLEKLRKTFETEFKHTFSVNQFHYLKYLTASLLFSLIPLHDDREKQIKYYNLAKLCISNQ